MKWYDGVKQSQGSVEISSMEQAKAINAAGIYVIGAFEENTSSTKMVRWHYNNYFNFLKNMIKRMLHNTSVLISKEIIALTNGNSGLI